MYLRSDSIHTNKIVIAAISLKPARGMDYVKAMLSGIEECREALMIITSG